MKEISDELYNKLDMLGMLPNEVRSHNVGNSDYAKHFIAPWSIIQEYDLNYWDGDIIKRVLRTKEGDSRKMDYEKIIHICQERIRQIDKMGDGDLFKTFNVLCKEDLTSQHFNFQAGLEYPAQFFCSSYHITGDNGEVCVLNEELFNKHFIKGK